MSLNTNLSYLGDQYRSEGMYKRKSGIYAGLGMRLIFLKLSYVKDIEGKSNGGVFNLNYNHRLPPMGDLFASIGLGFEINSTDYVDYFFGVEDFETTSSRPQYVGKTSFNYRVGLRMFYTLAENISLGLMPGIKFLDSNIHESPTVKKSTILSSMIIFSYRL